MSGKYTAARQAAGEARLSWVGDRVVAQLVSAEYIFNAGNKSAADIKGAVGAAVEITGKTLEGGWAKCSALTFPKVKGAEVLGMVVRLDSGGETTPIVYLDGIESFPMRPNGSDIVVAVPAQGLFRF
jgi:hypothetical protein